MRNLSYQDILNDIDARKFPAVYFFQGDEPYFIDLLTDYILEHAMEPDQRDFDQQVVYGKDFEYGGEAIFSSARRYPMLAEYQVIAVKEAQMIRGLEDDLAAYLENPTPSTILIFNYKGKKIDKRRKLASRLNDQVFFESNRLYDNEVPGWIRRCVEGQGYRIDEKSCRMLAECLGTDLSRIVTEVEKLKISLGGQSQDITPELVEANTGVSKDFNDFELVGALKSRDMAKAQRIAWYFARNPKDHPMPRLTVVLFDFFTKVLLYQYSVDKSPAKAASVLGVNPYFLRDYEQASRVYPVKKVLENLSLIREFDARSKGFGQVPVEDGELLRELLFRLMA